MPITTMTSRVKKAALAGPVTITDRGKPAHVLLSIQDYQKALGKTRSITDLLAMPEGGDIEIEVPVSKGLALSVDLD